MMIIYFTLILLFRCQKTMSRSDEVPLIIWWYDTIFPHVEDGRQVYEVKCNDNIICHSSNNRSMVKDNKFQTIMFYGSDFEPDDIPLPKRINQMWALLHEESPQNNYILFQPEISMLFNISATFKQKSDYPLTTQYVPTIGYLHERRPVDLDTKNGFRKKIAPVMYLQSHCDVPSDRDSYVQEMMTYIQVDSYGDCLHNKDFSDPKLEGMESMNDEKLLDIIANYKFHIAFENAICDDYITEKVYRALHVGSVPIYMGASNIKEWIPEGSFIEVSNFTSPRDLADFLNRLDGDDALYLKYLQFKEDKLSIPEKLQMAIKDRSWSAHNPEIPHYVNGFECFVCKKMHDILNENRFSDTSMSPSNQLELNKKFYCPPPERSFASSSMENKQSFYKWIGDYRQAGIQAKVLRNLVTSNDKDLDKFWEYVGNFMLKSEQRHPEL